MQYDHALQVARDLQYRLQLHCSDIYIAGSIRRKKPEVKDIEIVCLPKVYEHAADMFSTETKRIPSFRIAVEELGATLKGNSLNGKYMQIRIPLMAYKDTVIVDDTRLPAEESELSINLDLFMPDAHDFYRQLAIRTGSAEYAQSVIACGWRKLGWCGTDQGLRRTNECTNQERDPTKTARWKCTATKPTLPPHWQSEREFFSWLQVPYTQPKDR